MSSAFCEYGLIVTHTCDENNLTMETDTTIFKNTDVDIDLSIVKPVSQPDNNFFYDYNRNRPEET